MPRSQSGNSQLIGLLVVAAFVLGVMGFLFMGGGDEPVKPLPDAPIEEQDTPLEAGNLEPAPIRQTESVDIGSRTDIETAPELTGDQKEIGAIVSGSVVNEEGQPVAEAIVSLTQRYEAGTAMLAHQQQERHEALTDSKGRYRFRRLPANKDMNLWVYHGDYAPTQGPAFASLSEESQELPPVVLKSGYTLNGTVVDKGGNPLAAQITLRRQRSGFLAGTPEEQRDEDLALGRIVEVMADEQGRFHLVNLGEGIWILRADYAGFASAEIRPLLFMENKSVEEQRVVMDDEHRISGRAINENDEPIPDALVNVSRVQPRPILTGQARTEADGSFVVLGLAAGVYGLSIQAEGYTNGHAGRVQADTSTLEVVMQHKAGVSGRLTGPNGSPITNFSLEILRTRAGNKQFGITGQVYNFKSKDGSYSISSIDPGTFILLARARGFSATYSPSFRVDREEVLGIDISLKSGGTLVGQVVNGSDNKPLAGALVSLHGDEYNPDEIDSLFGASLGDPNNIPKLSVKTDKNGNFRLENAFPGTVQVLVTHPKYLSELVGTTVLDQGENELGTIRIYPGGSIFGLAKNKDGSALTGGNVNLSRQDGSSFFHKSVTVDARGRFRFDGLKAGSYEVIAYPSSNESVFLFPPEGDKKSVYVSDGEDVEVELNSSL